MYYQGRAFEERVYVNAANRDENGGKDIDATSREGIALLLSGDSTDSGFACGGMTGD